MSSQLYPEPTVGALIFNPDNQVLLIQSHKWRDQYAIPGGHVELGETLEAALRREVKEETHLDIYNLEFLCFHEFIFEDAFWERKHFIFFDYACRTDSTDVRLNDEGESYIWTSLEGTRDLPIEQFTRRTIQAYLKKQSR